MTLHSLVGLLSLFGISPLSMFGSNCCFLTWIQISQEAGKVFWFSHLFKNFSQFVAIHTVKGFSVVIKAELDVLLELSCFFYDPMDVGNFISLAPLSFLSSALTRPNKRDPILWWFRGWDLWSSSMDSDFRKINKLWDMAVLPSLSLVSNVQSEGNNDNYQPCCPDYKRWFMELS